MQETKEYIRDPVLIALDYGIKFRPDPWLRVLSSVIRNSTPPRFVNSQLVAFCQFFSLTPTLQENVPPADKYIISLFVALILCSFIS